MLYSERFHCITTLLFCAQTLLCPQTSYYSKLSEEFVDAGVGIDLFISTTSYNDLATITQCVSTTGGRLHHYPAFKVGGAGMLILVGGGVGWGMYVDLMPSDCMQCFAHPDGMLCFIRRMFYY